MNKKILVIEDNEDLAGLLEIHLKDMSCDVIITHDGMSGMAMAEEQDYDLIILDLMLPGIDGLEILRRVRAKPSYTPVLILTSKSSELDRVLGLEIGADDYVTKPFSIRELQARVKAIFRRIEHIQMGNRQKPSIIRQGDINVDPEKRSIILKDRTLVLTAKEFDLLLHFVKHPGRVYTRPQLLDEVWGYGHDGYEHTVNSHINRLRTKIEEDPTNPRYILTVWGVGYKFAENLEEDNV
jgi:DNA-binding response OmpR family regulator